MNKTAIVIGATGLIGQALVDQLAAADFIGRVVTLTRRPAGHPSGKVHNQVVRFEHLEAHAEVFSGDMLFSCLGTTRKQAGSIAAQRVIDVDYQFKAAQLAAGQGVPHYLLVSSSGANARSRNAYLQMKGELEQRVQDLGFDRISIFQPSLLLGRRAAPRPGELLWSAILPPLCVLPGLRRFRPIRAIEVAAKMVRVSANPGPPLAWFRLDEIFL